MRKMNNIIKNIALSFLSVTLFTGCLQEKDNASKAQQNVLIQMSVSAGAMTKAESTSAEKAINSLRIYAFYGERLAGYAARQATSLGEPFYMDLELPESGIHDVDFYLIANEAEMSYENGLVQLSENMTKEQLEAVKFTGLARRAALPMYSRKRVAINVDNISSEVNDEAAHMGHLILSQKVAFDLTRSLAKLSVYASKVEGAATNPQILSVSLLAQGTREYSYLFEQGEQTLDAVPQRANNRSFQLATSSVSYETVIVDGVYLPEVSAGVDLATDEASYKWNIDSGDAGAAVLHVEYSLGEGQDLRNGYIYLPRIKRNHHLKVCILINAEGQIIVNYVVADWDWDEDKMQDWFFDYPTHTYVWHLLPLLEEDYRTKPSSKATMSEIKPFAGYFQMTYPTSDTWVPTLEGLNASRCSVKVYNVTSGDLVYSDDEPSPLPVSEDWYRIEVSPNQGHMDAGDVVNLAITYTPGGLTESEYLLINGAHHDYFWPGSSNENYITITMVN